MGVGTILGRAANRTGALDFIGAQAGKPEGRTASWAGADEVGVASQAGGTVGAASKSDAGLGVTAETGTTASVDGDGRSGGTTRGKANASIPGSS
jgi:hypothetical protein